MTEEIGINRLSRRAFLRAGLVFGAGADFWFPRESHGTPHVEVRGGRKAGPYAAKHAHHPRPRREPDTRELAAAFQEWLRDRGASRHESEIAQRSARRRDQRLVAALLGLHQRRLEVAPRVAEIAFDPVGLSAPRQGLRLEVQGCRRLLPLGRQPPGHACHLQISAFPDGRPGEAFTRPASHVKSRR